MNVFTPGCDDRRRPVLVFIHGGAFLIGTGGGVMYRGEALARRGVVVVTFNYRLGALGFLAHPDLAVTPGAPFANWGVLDQLAALAFVQEHIASFGGDPRNVTLFGESAGAMSTADLLAVPRATGLFRRAVIESGATAVLSIRRAAHNAERFAKALGLRGVDRTVLSQVPVAEVLAAQATLLGDLGVGASMPFQPIVDGLLIPEHPDAVLAAGGGSVDALMVGTNRDEFRLFTIGQRQLDDASDQALAPYVSAYLPRTHDEDAVALIRKYRSIAAARGESPNQRQLFESIAGDAVFWAPAMRLASASASQRPTFVYRFDWTSPFMGGALGACHGLELPFVFGTITNPFVALFAGDGAPASDLCEMIQSAWVSFATNGHPGAAGGIEWPRYEDRRRATLLLGSDRSVLERPREEERLIWERLLGQYGVAAATEAATGT
jgi:para-nitrobenzyl esterase